MIQYKAFIGTVTEIAEELNRWLAALPNGVNVNAGPLTRVDGDQWFKEVMYVLPARNNGQIAVPRAMLKGEPH